MHDDGDDGTGSLFLSSLKFFIEVSCASWPGSGDRGLGSLTSEHRHAQDLREEGPESQLQLRSFLVDRGALPQEYAGPTLQGFARRANFAGLSPDGLPHFLFHMDGNRVFGICSAAEAHDRATAAAAAEAGEGGSGKAAGEMDLLAMAQYVSKLTPLILAKESNELQSREACCGC